MSSHHPDLSRVLNEPCTYLMWPRAALMQLAVESVAATEIESGSYGMRGARRWANTVGYLRVIAHGDEDDIRFLVRDVNNTHSQLHVPAADVAAKRRPALDPAHQLWVGTTWFLSIIDAYQMFVAPLDDETVEALYAQFTTIGTVLQMRASDWPENVAALRAYAGRMQDRYPVGLARSAPGDDPSQVTAADVAVHVFPSYSLKRRYLWLLPRIRLLTWGMASDQLRAAYGREWDDDLQKQYVRTVRRWRVLYHCCPGPLRRRTGKKQRKKMMADYYSRGLTKGRMTRWEARA